MASHPPLYSLVLDLNIHPPHALSGCFPVIRPQGPACSSLSPVRPFPCPFLLPHLSPPSVYYITGLGGYAHFCRCDPCFFVLSYPGKFLGPSVRFFWGAGFQESGVSRNPSNQTSGCPIGGLPGRSCGCTRGSKQ